MMFYNKMTEVKQRKQIKAVMYYFNLQAYLNTCAWIMFMCIYSITYYPSHINRPYH